MTNGDSWYVEHKGTEDRSTDEGRKGNAYSIARNRLVEVLRAYGMSEYVEPDNREWQAVHCPFHGDDNASASINLRKLFFRCHGCGAAGTAIALVMDQEGLTKKEAVEWITKL